MGGAVCGNQTSLTMDLIDRRHVAAEHRGNFHIDEDAWKQFLFGHLDGLSAEPLCRQDGNPNGCRMAITREFLHGFMLAMWLPAEHFAGRMAAG